MYLEQRITVIGYVGIVLAVGCPILMMVIASWSVSGIVDVFTSRYSVRTIDDYAVHPIIYAGLLLLSSAGWVMLILGRKYEAVGAGWSTVGRPPEEQKYAGFKSRFQD